MSEDKIKFWGFVAQCLGITVTFFTALIALRTSNNAYKAFMLDKRPYLTFDKIQFTPILKVNYKQMKNVEKLNGYISFKNIGKTIAYCEVKKVVVDIYDDSNERIVMENNNRINALRERIFPDTKSSFSFSSSSGNFFQEIEGDIEFTIVYYRDENEEKYEWNMKLKFTTSMLGNVIYEEIVEDNERIIQPTGIINRIRRILGL